MMSNNVLLAIVTPLKYAGPNPLKSMLQTTAESLVKLINLHNLQLVPVC